MNKAKTDVKLLTCWSQRTFESVRKEKEIYLNKKKKVNNERPGHETYKGGKFALGLS